MENRSAKQLVGNLPIRQLPYSFRGGKVIDEMRSFDRIIVHHHVDPIVAFRLAKIHGQKTLWYTGDVLRAAWERKTTGQDYRKLSPNLSSTARAFYGRFAELALSHSFYGLTTSFARFLDRTTVYRYLGVIANSLYTAETLRDVYQYGRKISVVYPCSSFSSITPRIGDGEYVLGVGALTPTKNFVALVKSMGQIKEKPPLIIAGEGPEETLLHSTARRFRVPLKIIHGASDAELISLYQGSYFNVIPSLSEAFGMTAVEAALAGKPTIATEVGGTKEFVQRYHSGITINPYDVEQLTQAIRLLLENRGLRIQLGEHARETALRKFGLENSVNSLLEILEQ
jgi:glycosyltransferase involved in cell wall biosynthesis